MRFGPRPVLLAGICTLVAGLILFATAPGDVPYFPLLLVAFVVMGLGGGSTFVPLLTIAATTSRSRSVRRPWSPGCC